MMRRTEPLKAIRSTLTICFVVFAAIGCRGTGAIGTPSLATTPVGTEAPASISPSQVLTPTANHATPVPTSTPGPARPTLSDDERSGQIVSKPRFGRCSDFTIGVEEGEPTIAVAPLIADVTVVGEISEIGGTRYNVVAGELTGERDMGWFDVVRPTIVGVEHTVRGGPIDEVIKVRLPAGRLGCDTYHFDRVQAVDGPGRYVLFLSDEPDARGETVPELTVVRAWRINDSNLIETPFDGLVAVEDFLLRAPKD